MNNLKIIHTNINNIDKNTYNYFLSKNIIVNKEFNKENIRLIINPTFLFSRKNPIKNLDLTNKLLNESCYIITMNKNISKLFETCKILYLTCISLNDIHKYDFIKNELSKLHFTEYELNDIYIYYIEDNPFIVLNK
jgi:hypothetical protein